MMKHRLLKYKLILFIICQNVISLIRGNLSFRAFRFALKKQIIISSRFNDSKYTAIGDKIFLDPFAPYFPSRYFTQALSNSSVGTYPLKPVYAQIAITNHCPCNCFHCHVMNTYADDIPREIILKSIEEMIELDFPLIFFVGGEPLSRFDDLVSFIKASRQHMDTRIFTSGVGADLNRLKALKQAGLEGICVSLDHYDESIHNHQRGHHRAFESACRTVQEASKMGFYVSTVCCTTHAMVASGEICKVVDFAESLGAHAIQINEIRPVGRARLQKDNNLYLSPTDKKYLIDYYKRENSSHRKIAIVMPWYNEAPNNFGCLATTGQKAYIDAMGNVQPCELLKLGLGNIKVRPFKDIWRQFQRHCGHPVRDCIVHPLVDAMDQMDALPVPPAQTYALWPKFRQMETTDMFKKFGIRKFNENSKAFAGKYDLDIREGSDFFLKSSHWLPRKLGVAFIAFHKTIYCRDAIEIAPRHEFLHIAQFRRYGIFRVLMHYGVHLLKNYIHFKDFKQAFKQVPFEIEARAYEAAALAHRDGVN